MNKSEKAAAKALLQFFGIHMTKWIVIIAITRSLKKWAESLPEK